ncbi:uncharacterized protein [Euwallacea similis]|uniref:uncharacterized protein n=1 Tax=Euwallacea similis TaxID=1736056 RepID=UPI00344B4807
MELTDCHKLDERHYHCSDCNITMHLNDKDKHINGAKHKFRERKIITGMPESPTVEPHQFECTICKTKFSNKHFFEIHRGSKTHKRNVRREEKKLEKEPSEWSVKPKLPGLKGRSFLRTSLKMPIKSSGGAALGEFLPEHLEDSDYKSTREKYRPRNMNYPEGYNKAYICTVAAYWAVSLALDSAISDFKICLNDKEWGDFGDVVIQVEFKETEEHSKGLNTTFAIQFKDICSNVKSIDTLAEGRFSFAKFLTQINKVKVKDEHSKFVVFTTALPSGNMDRQIRIKTDLLHKSGQECSCELKETLVVAKTLNNRKKLLINTSDDNDNIYFFYCKDNMHILSRLYLYTHQSKQKHFGTEINELISELLYEDTKVQLHKEIIKFIENWSDGLLGGSYKLKKEDVLVKLTHLLLSPFKVASQARSTAQICDYSIWHQAISSVDVTVLSPHPAIVYKLCDPLNQNIEQILGLKIDSSTRSIDLGQNTIQRITNSVLKMYLFEETLGELHDHVPLDVVYDFFWKAGLMPLLLEVKDLKEQQRVLHVVSMVKSLGITRRYFLITPVEDIKTSLRYYVKTVSFFVNLSNLISKLPLKVFKMIAINITDSFSISLLDILVCDEFFQNSVTAQEFYDMSLGNYSFKSFNNSLARNHGNVTQLVLDDKMLMTLKKELNVKDEVNQPFLFLYDDDSQVEKILRGINPNLFS